MIFNYWRAWLCKWEIGDCELMMSCFAFFFFFRLICKCDRNGNVRPRGAVPWEEHPRVLGPQDSGHRWRHQTKTSAARSEREEYSAQRQSSVHRQHVSGQVHIWSSPPGGTWGGQTAKMTIQTFLNNFIRKICWRRWCDLRNEGICMRRAIDI